MTEGRVEPVDPEHVERAEYTASLRVSSDRLSLGDLTRQLGQPTDGHDIGDPISKSKPEGPTRKDAVWLLTSPIERDRPLQDHIEDLVAFADEHRDQLAELRSSCTIDISCEILRGDDAARARPAGFIVFGCGFALLPDLMTRLAALDLGIAVDIY